MPLTHPPVLPLELELLVEPLLEDEEVELLDEPLLEPPLLLVMMPLEPPLLLVDPLLLVEPLDPPPGSTGLVPPELEPASTAPPHAVPTAVRRIERKRSDASRLSMPRPEQVPCLEALTRSRVFRGAA